MLATERPTGHEKLTPTMEDDLALCLLYVSNAFFHPWLVYVVFSLVTPIPKCNGLKYLVLLFLVVSTVMTFTILQVVGVLP